jgi:hypothetical protein
MPLFHLAPLRLAAGSVIEPGNWGRILKRYQNPHAQQQTMGNGWLMARELVYEIARLNFAPEAPSRFQSCFAVESLEAAQRSELPQCDS